MIINQDLSYTPPVLKGNGWVELWGAKVKTFLKQLQWEKDGACQVLEDRSIDEHGNSVSDKAITTFIYQGKAGDKIKALLLGQLHEPLRVFQTSDAQGYEDVKAQLIRNKGYLDSQIKEIGTTLTDNNANALYTWEDNFFGVDKHIKTIAAKSKYSIPQAKKAVEGTKAVVLTESEAVALVKEIANKYGLKNVDLQFGPSRDGRVLGYCAPLDDATTPLALPLGVKVWFNDAVIYQDLVLHEMSHAIEMFRTGRSAHGKGFRDIYRVLLKTYAGVDPVGL